MSQLTHLDAHGLPRTVDVSDKSDTLREAEAALWIGCSVMAAINDGRTQKGSIFETARIAGVMGAKHTTELIPLCHPVQLTHVSVDFELLQEQIMIRSTAKTCGATGVEMEAQ